MIRGEVGGTGGERAEGGERRGCPLPRGQHGPAPFAMVSSIGLGSSGAWLPHTLLCFSPRCSSLDEGACSHQPLGFSQLAVPLSFDFLIISSVQSLSHVQLFTTPWTAAHQASVQFGSRHHSSWVVSAVLVEMS